MALIDPVIPQLNRINANGDFAKVDDLPGLGLPIGSLPWIVLGSAAWSLWRREPGAADLAARPLPPFAPATAPPSGHCLG